MTLTKKIENFLGKHYVDVTVGKMTLRAISNEIHHQMIKLPENLVVSIKRENDGYYAIFYMSKEDFKKDVHYI